VAEERECWSLPGALRVSVPHLGLWVGPASSVTGQLCNLSRPLHLSGPQFPRQF
jgi:hypothetical protein